jgi:hypothetical protein
MLKRTENGDTQDRFHAGQGKGPPNLLVLGASGNVARALLRRLGGRRAHFGRLVLLDKSNHVLNDPFLEHRRLDYQFIWHRLRMPEERAYYQRLLRRHRIDIVLDVTDMDTLPLLAATDAEGVSYVGTSLNDDQRDVPDLVAEIQTTSGESRGAPHVLCTGMNPGVVNIWVWHGVRRYGVPREIIHFEYDTSMSVDRWRPIITWSRKEFLTEIAWETTGQVLGGNPILYRTNALHHRQDMRTILEPVVPLCRAVYVVERATCARRCRLGQTGLSGRDRQYLHFRH